MLGRKKSHVRKNKILKGNLTSHETRDFTSILDTRHVSAFSFFVAFSKNVFKHLDMCIFVFLLLLSAARSEIIQFGLSLFMERNRYQHPATATLVNAGIQLARTITNQAESEGWDNSERHQQVQIERQAEMRSLFPEAAQKNSSPKRSAIPAVR